MNIFKQLPKATVVIGVSDNGLPLIAPADDVVKSSGEMDARAASHAVPLAPHSDNIKQPNPDTGFYGAEHDIRCRSPTTIIVPVSKGSQKD